MLVFYQTNQKYERDVNKSKSAFFTAFINFQVDFSQGNGALCYVFVIIKRFRNIRDQIGVFAEVLSDLFKAIYPLLHTDQK